MKRGIVFSAGLGSGALLMLMIQPYLFPPEIEAVFSPEDGDRVVSFIDSAERSIDIEVYVFTSRDVLEALERAKSRGVEIRIILEKRVLSGQNAQMFSELAAKGFAVRYAGRIFDLTHSKFIIIDGEAVLVGSHNLSNSALFENREASVIIRDAEIVEEFQGIFNSDWSIST
ncbi:MAG: phospholipase D-like domain-containing protein [Candidatus Micrarchaeota archaeon]